MPFSLLKFSDENNTAKLVLDIWRHCSNRPFPNLILFQIFLFRLCFRKFVKQFASLSAIISALNATVRSLIKLPLSSFNTSSQNLENWKASIWKNKTQSPWNLIFSLRKSFPILWGRNYFQNTVLSFWLTSSDWNSVNCSVEFKWTLFPKAAVQQSFTK